MCPIWYMYVLCARACTNIYIYRQSSYARECCSCSPVLPHHQPLHSQFHLLVPFWREPSVLPTSLHQATYSPTPSLRRCHVRYRHVPCRGCAWRLARGVKFAGKRRGRRMSQRMHHINDRANLMRASLFVCVYVCVSVCRH